MTLRLISRRQIDDELFAILIRREGRGMEIYIYIYMKARSDVSFVAVREREKNEPWRKRAEEK